MADGEPPVVDEGKMGEQISPDVGGEDDFAHKVEEEGLSLNLGGTGGDDNVDGEDDADAAAREEDLARSLKLLDFGTTRTFNPPGSKTQMVERAPSPNLRKSKRYDVITDETEKLQQDQTFLRAQAIAKNRAFILRVQALHERIGRWKERLDVETKAREVQDASVREVVSKLLVELDESFMAKLEREHSKIEDEEIPAVWKRYDLWWDDFREFVDVTVPAVVERQQGEVTRALHKARETFEIDCTKLMKREQRIVDAFEVHVEEARSMYEQEEKTRKRLQQLLEEQIDERARVWDRCEEDFYSPYMDQITEMKHSMDAEVKVRTAQDMVVLSTMKESMDRLQEVILNNFGAQMLSESQRSTPVKKK